MDFLQKLDFMMGKYALNKRTLSQNSGIPYTTIDGWYKKGYEGMKLSTLRTLSGYFNTVIDFWARDEVSDPDAWKTHGFAVDAQEMEGIKKYRLLDRFGKEAVAEVLNAEYRRYEQAGEEEASEQRRDETSVYFIVPCFTSPMSAGSGQPAGDEFPENYKLIREPPRGTSFIAPVSGHSMEPSYCDGQLVFVHAAEEIPVGEIGVFWMDGQQWIKELGDGVLISHNPDYRPRPMTDDVRCQGLVLGVCGESYFPDCL